MVADIDELEEMEASRRLNAKKVLTPLGIGNFIFPFADGTEKKLRERTGVWEHPA